MMLKGHEDCPPIYCAAGLDAGFDLAFSNELHVDHSITCPMITTASAGRPAHRARLHQYLRPADAAALALRRAGRQLRRLVEEWPQRQAGRHHRHRPPVARARRPAPVRYRTAPTRSSTARPSSGSPTATSKPLSQRSALDSLWTPGNATHGFIDFMLMMGVAGGRARPTTSTPSTCSTPWRHTSPGTRMGADAVSKYLVNKFLYTDRSRPRAGRALSRPTRAAPYLVGNRARPASS